MIKLNGQKQVVRQSVPQLSFDYTVCHSDQDGYSSSTIWKAKNQLSLGLFYV